MTTFKEFAIGKFVLRFYKTDHVWTCTMTENMLDEVTKELALQRLSDIGQAIEQEPVAWMVTNRDSGIGYMQTDEPTRMDKVANEYLPLYTHPENEYKPNQTLECSFNLAGFKPPAKTLNFFEISIDDKYVIRIYKSGIYESELGNLSAKMPIEEWNEHAKNVKEILKKASEK